MTPQPGEAWRYYYNLRQEVVVLSVESGFVTARRQDTGHPLRMRVSQFVEAYRRARTTDDQPRLSVRTGDPSNQPSRSRLHNTNARRTGAATQQPVVEGEVGRAELPSVGLPERPKSTGAAPRFTRGDTVRLHADRTREGVVTDGPRPGASSFDYEVFFGSQRAWYAEADLLPAMPQERLRWESGDELLRDLLLAKLRNPLTDSLYSYRASRTEFAAYQFRPALKFLRNPDRGLLIADEVGLGKTIEAAIIYLELKARLDISRVLVLCPSRLTDKWQTELRDRFEEEFQVLDAAGARRLLSEFERLGASFPIRAIASFELLRRGDFLDQLTALNIPLDLLIVDEAHHLRNAATATHRLGETLVNAADTTLFLTATPLSLRNRDLYNLLSLLAPEDFDNPDLFEEQVWPNQHVNQAARLVAAGQLADACAELRRVEQTSLRDRFLLNPFYGEVTQKLRAGGALSMGDRVKLQRELIELNTLASVFTRTRKREIADTAVRASYSVLVELSPPERAFYEGVLRQTREELRRSGRGAPGFATVMKERQAASCLIAMREVFEKSARQQRPAAIEVDRSPFDLYDPDEEARAPNDEELLFLSRQIGAADAKLDKFEETLYGALADDPTSKALVFSFFRHTLDYLRRRLTERGHRVAVIHGGIRVDDRRRIIERFREDPETRVLLSSEVGAEGLDFQFCDVLVNYDLPWNPMQVEQRIGRLDRFGQRHERIRIYNFFLADTIETRIFQRLYERIRIFERSIGDLEEILGQVIQELSREVLQASLTPAEQERLVDQAAAAIAQRQQAEEELERHKDELLGQGSILDQQIDEVINSGRVISPEEVRALVTTFIAGVDPRARLIRDDEEPCWTVDLDFGLSEYVRAFIERKRMHHRVSHQFQAALNRRGRVALTFDNEYARQRPNLEFVTVRHVLAEAARAYWSGQDLRGIPASGVELAGPPEEVGDGFFFVYVLDVKAVAKRVTLEPVVVLDDGRMAAIAAGRLLRELQGSDIDRAASARENGDGAETAERLAASVISLRRHNVEEEVRRRNEALLAARAASIKTSFDAKIRRTRELLVEAREPRIVRMREAQIRNLDARQQSKLEDLEGDREVAVSYELIAAGRARVILEQVASSIPSQPSASRRVESVPGLERQDLSHTAESLPYTYEQLAPYLTPRREGRAAETSSSAPREPKTDTRESPPVRQGILDRWLSRWFGRR